MSGWTPERIEILSRMWLGGSAGSAIGRELGISRCAAIAKAIRLGLVREKPSMPARMETTDPRRKVWTDEKTEQLRQLWHTDLSREQIAVQLGEGFTLMGVGAKAKRLGLINRRTGPYRPARRAPVARTAHAADKRERATIKQAFRSEHLFAPLEGVASKPFHERRLDECRWPITDPADDDGVSRLSCCAPRVANSSYCRTHRALGVAADTPMARVGWDQASHRRRV
jgi:hypothetical protein